MSEITPFDFKGNQLRTLTDSQGEPWFVAKDVCDILEIRTNSLRAILEPDEISELSNDNSIDIAQNGMRFRKSMTQDVLRGAKEIQARLGTNDLVEILYAEATI